MYYNHTELVLKVSNLFMEGALSKEANSVFKRILVKELDGLPKVFRYRMLLTWVENEMFPIISLSDYQYNILSKALEDSK